MSRYISAEIIDDDADDDNTIATTATEMSVVSAYSSALLPDGKKKKRVSRKTAATISLTTPAAAVAAPVPEPKPTLAKWYTEDASVVEMGVDEAGRGPLFGRVYAAAVVLPKGIATDAFDYTDIKDSKKFHSKKKIADVAEYIKTHAIAWSVKYADEQTIDEINILQATQQAMHEAIIDIAQRLDVSSSSGAEAGTTTYQLLIDGNYFVPILHKHSVTKKLSHMPFVTIEQGDGKYASIAAASILAKVARDAYIQKLCAVYPVLQERYCLHKNMGYAANVHREGIKQHGITQWHRRTFGICKTAALICIPEVAGFEDAADDA